MKNTFILSASILLAALIVVYAPQGGSSLIEVNNPNTIEIENGFARIIIEDNGQDKFLQIRGKLTVKISNNWARITEHSTGETYIVPKEAVSYIGREVKGSSPSNQVKK